MADGMAEWRNGGNCGMAERQKEWQNGKMAEMDTYVLFMVHANTNDTDDDDTLIFYSIDMPIGASPLRKCLFSHSLVRAGT